MAFTPATLSQLAHGNNWKLFVYTSGSDNIAAINSSGYFNDASDMLGVRDLIIVVDTATPTTHFCTVLSNSGGVVDVSDGTAVAETDGD